MDMYNALKCPEEEVISTTESSISQSTEEITSEVSKLDTQVTSSTALKTNDEDIQPKVIIKNPQKMMEDIFDSIDVNAEVDSNRLDDSDPHKMDLDLMVGDQPMDEDESDKKILLKQPDKKEIFKKKSDKLKDKLKAKDDEMMMGDAPAADNVQISTTENNDIPTSTVIISTTDRQRRDANLIAETTTALNDMSESTTNDASTTEELSSLSTDSPQASSTESIITTMPTEEPTTKIIVQGHPMHMPQGVFKEPIQPDHNGTHERINFSDADAFIPPMLLVKAKFTTTTSTGTETTVIDNLASSSSSSSTESVTIFDITDIADDISSTTVEPSTTVRVESNEISPVNDTAQVENTITTVDSSEKPIMVGKRTDPRLGLKDAMSSTTTHPPPTTEQLTTIMSSSEIPSSTTESVDESTTDSSMSTFEITADSSSLSSTIIDETEGTVEIATTTLQSSGSAEKLIADVSTTTIITSPAAATAVKPSSKTETMRNDIDAYHHPNDDTSELSEHLETEGESSSEDEHHHVDNSFSNAENYQPFKPNRHRSIMKHDQHHGPGFSIGKILG